MRARGDGRAAGTSWRDRGGAYRGRGAGDARWGRNNEGPDAEPRQPRTHRAFNGAAEGGKAQSQSQLQSLPHAKPAVGTCMQMCPRAEVAERTRTMEISRFERSPPGTVPSSSNGEDGDALSFAVKKYRRAAAGQIEIDRTELRPPSVLLRTLQHLFTNVLPWRGCGFDWRQTADASRCSAALGTEREQLDFLALYHFVSDRVRSVRKDFTVQRIGDAAAVDALEQIVRFHVLASLRARTLLQPAQQGDWSETLNDQQLASALSQLQVLYQKCSAAAGRLEDQAVEKTATAANMNQSEFVAYDILLHADDPRAISFMLVKVPEATRRSAHVKRALALFVALQVQDFHTFSRTFESASPLEKSLLLKHLPAMWTAGVQMMNKAFGKQDQFRLEEFAGWLRLAGVDAARMLCGAMHLHTEALPAPQTPEAPGAAHSSSALATSDSWENGALQLPPAPPQKPEAQPAGFIRFKVSPLNVEIDKVTVEQLLVDTARQIFFDEIQGLRCAADLILKATHTPAATRAAAEQ